MEALTPGSAGDLPPLGELIVDVPFWRHRCASGPFFSSSSSRAHCCGLSRSRGTGPFDLSASAPPSRQVLSYRRTDPSVTRRSCVISLIVSPRANRPAAPGRCCSAGVYPPRCAYRISGHTPATSRRHHPSSTSSPWVKCRCSIKCQRRQGSAAAKCSNRAVRHRPYMTVNVLGPASMTLSTALPLDGRERIADSQRNTNVVARLLELTRPCYKPSARHPNTSRRRAGKLCHISGHKSGE